MANVIFLAMFMGLVLGVVLAVAAALLRYRPVTHKAKRREDSLDPLLDDLPASGRLVLDADGELPDWVDALADKPKRHAED